MNYFVNHYMEHSKNKVGLCIILGVMEFMNTPLKILYLLIPITAYILVFFNRDRLMIPFIPVSIQPVYELCVNILLIAIFITLLIAVIVTVGRKVHDDETALFAEALYNSQAYRNESNQTIHLIYKRKRKGITERRIYSHIERGKWREKSPNILQLFNAHFVDPDYFQYVKNNSRIIIMRTAEGIEKPVKTEWRDSALDKDLEEV